MKSKVDKESSAVRIRPTRKLLQTGVRHPLLQTAANHTLQINIIGVPSDSLEELVQEPDMEE